MHTDYKNKLLSCEKQNFCILLLLPAAFVLYESSPSLSLVQGSRFWAKGVLRASRRRSKRLSLVRSLDDLQVRSQLLSFLTCPLTENTLEFY